MENKIVKDQYEEARKVLFGNSKPSTGVTARGGIDFPSDPNLSLLARSFHANGGAHPNRFIRNNGGQDGDTSFKLR